MADISRTGLAQFMNRLGGGRGLMEMLGRGSQGAGGGQGALPGRPSPDGPSGLNPALTLSPAVKARVAAYEEGLNPAEIRTPSEMRPALRHAMVRAADLFAGAPTDAAKLGGGVLRSLESLATRMAFGAASQEAGAEHAVFHFERNGDAPRARLELESAVAADGADLTTFTFVGPDRRTVVQIATAPKMADGEPVLDKGRPVLTRTLTAIEYQLPEETERARETYSWEATGSRAARVRMEV